MSCKRTTVTLQCCTLGVTQEFEISHAERLLRMPKNGGWKLPKKSEFEFENGTIIRRNKKADKGAEETRDN